MTLRSPKCSSTRRIKRQSSRSGEIIFLAAPVISFSDRGRRVSCRTLLSKSLLVAVACGIAAVPASLHAQFQTLETPTARLIYTSPLQSYLVPQVLTGYENALRFHEKLWGY